MLKQIIGYKFEAYEHGFIVLQCFQLQHSVSHSTETCQQVKHCTLVQDLLNQHSTLMKDILKVKKLIRISKYITDVCLREERGIEMKTTAATKTATSMPILIPNHRIVARYKYQPFMCVLCFVLYN